MGRREFVWVTRDKQRIPLSQMTDSHLQNTINYLENRAAKEDNAYWSVGSMLQGEFAQMEWENSFDELNEKLEVMRSIVDLMKNEQSRRRHK
jgi:hypothetical protein